MNIDRTANNGPGSGERSQSVCEDYVRLAVFIAGDVSKVTNVPHSGPSVPVRAVCGVEVWPGRLAAVGEVSQLVHMHPMHKGSVVTRTLIHLQAHHVHMDVQVSSAFLLPEADESLHGLLELLCNCVVGLQFADGQVVLSFRQLYRLVVVSLKQAVVFTVQWKVVRRCTAVLVVGFVVVAVRLVLLVMVVALMVMATRVIAMWFEHFLAVAVIILVVAFAGKHCSEGVAIHTT